MHKNTYKLLYSNLIDSRERTLQGRESDGEWLRALGASR